MKNLKEKVAKGAVWTLCEKLSCQAVKFIIDGGLTDRNMIGGF